MRIRSAFSHTRPKPSSRAHSSRHSLSASWLALRSLARGGGKPSGGGTNGGSLAIVMVDDANSNHAPNWNDTVTFDVSTTATNKPWVLLDCYQDGAWVSTSTAGYFDAYPWDPNFTLASGGWTGGAADCTAKLYRVASNGRSQTLTTMSFHVDP